MLPFRAERHEIGCTERIGQPVFHAQCCQHVKSQQGEVRDILIAEGLVLQMGVNESQPPEGLFPERVVVEVGDEDALRITGDHVGY